ncbi:50S ribosomal protein L15 [Candidatus Gottesmanbacteria bacterium RBG_13_45_10]|uniref:Large ribosomal subunit protein uL15 n=1 Tax=Candidatus Gottesmanbacteria bacterium RBG_13_45_10 TaxID=1798370 RepID=A0A1F5ZH64_9BACT|nr:MAG: 50S ribosomal protein L15 [Candidatus Gottesmanbacteria bacterium RBG_13_45_10]
MNLSTLSPIVARSKKRIGRGHGSGKVKTAGRGTKGQNARDSMPLGFEGGQLSILKRLPLLRGKGRNHSQKRKAYPISVSVLSALPSGTVVTLATLRKYHMIDEDVTRVKVLGHGALSTKLTVAVPCSKSALRVIEKAGGILQKT